MRFLIADDHAIVVRGIKQLLQEDYPHAEISGVGDAEELLKSVALQNWDLVLCDLNMPGRNGIEALIQIKQMRPHLPVLIMSMYPEEHFAVRVMRNGAAGFLSKDTLHHNLLAAVRQALLGKKFVTQSVAEKLAEAIDDRKVRNLHEQLSNREFEVFLLLANGKSTGDIAHLLSLSVATVSTYRARIFDKMHVHSVTDLTRYALEHKLI
ncbi:MAG: response regulator transcription factor [Chitinophagales bacterium]|nr:response regulator transcription factor [Chitinophagales bacterium]